MTYIALPHSVDKKYNLLAASAMEKKDCTSIFQLLQKLMEQNFES